MSHFPADPRLQALEAHLTQCRGLLVAFSGGVDSAVLAVLAREVLGEETVYAVFIESPFSTRTEARDAMMMARSLGVRSEVIRVPFPDDLVARNAPDRCYHCKKSLSRVLKHRAEELGLPCVADGIHASDISEHRPGLRGSTEEGVLHPFLDAGITKDDIRRIARERGLPFWDKPSAACLASRIPYGERITEDNLRRVEAAEAVLREEGFSRVRVRSHGAIARIEVAPGEIPRLVARRDRVVPRLKETGFAYVALDLEGYRSGSMDEVLASPCKGGDVP